MLKALTIKNYVLIDSLEITFPKGLIIITGQTGAGKSILLGALSLLLGSKADASVIGNGAESCVVEAEFSIPDELKDVLDREEIDAEDGHIAVRRVVNRSGRSRSFINDCPVNSKLLTEISSRLVDIHSQHQSLLLTDKSFQLTVLDKFSGNAGLLNRSHELWRELQRMEAERDALKERQGRLLSDKKYNESRFNQLEAASLKSGELEDLEAEQQKLANAEMIKESLCEVQKLYDPQCDELLSVDSALRSAVHSLDRIKPFLPEVSSLSTRIASARLELGDVFDEIGSLNAAMDVPQDRLQQVEERMSLLYDLMRKFGCADIEELIAAREEYSSLLFDTSSLDSRIDQLEKEIGAKRVELSLCADQLHSARENAASGFSSEIMDSIRFLELDRAVFSVSLSPVEIGPDGYDRVSFMFSASGIEPSDISKCASGGELSRIMLSLKSMMAKCSDMPTMIFDEIDTGVSGSVADKMGSMICRMGNDMQVFAITHLPQVAAKGDAHLLVNKRYDAASGREVSSISRLDEKERIMELARMLSGSQITDAAIANAKSLLLS